jgi:hypothetical protein
MIKKARDVIPEFLDSYIMRDARKIGALFASWEFAAEELKIAGLADHARIAELERNIVIIEADHPGWIQILQTKRREMIAGFKLKFPELNITGVSFRLSKGAIPSRASYRDLLKKFAEPPEPPPQNAEENIFETDERLKKLLLKLLMVF